MNNENKFYVYLHRRKSDNKVFYVGKGHSKRAYCVHGRNLHWNNTRNKHGLVVEIVFDSLSEEDAFIVERNTILEFRYFGHPLCNLTDGGEGSTGYKWTDEQMKNHGSLQNVGRKQSESEIANRRKVLIGHVVSSETKEKLRAANIPSIVFASIVKALVKCTSRKLGPNINTSGIINSSADPKIYTFKRVEDGFLFTGTRLQLCNEYNLRTKDFGKIFYVKGRVTSQGWTILKD